MMRWWLGAFLGGLLAGTAWARVDNPNPGTDQAYLASLWPISMVVDPDWYPYEALDVGGEHIGIAADLLKIIFRRAGVGVPVLQTKSWDESLRLSREGRATLVSFLNQTPQREEWLVFTKPYFADPNVFITREEHEFISDPARLVGETVALPSGTSMEERLRTLYPNLTIVIVDNETEALRAVDQRRVDMTLRSLTMAAYTIRRDGLFNLKIAGQISELSNEFRIGVKKTEPRLRDLLDRAIATLTPQDVQAAIDRHIAIRVQTRVDYTLTLVIGLSALVLVAGAVLWIRQLRRLNAALAQRDAEKALILREVHHRVKNNMNTIQGLLFLQAQSMPDSAAATALEDAQARVQSMMLLYDKIYRNEAYGPVEAQTYLGDLVDKILENFPAAQFVRVEKAIAPLSLAPQVLQPLGIVLNELLTNVMKYAFRGRSEGLIVVSLQPVGDQLELIVEDDGPGLPEAVDFENSTGFGLQLIGLLSRQLGGSIRIDRDHGARVVLTFPPAGP